MDLKVDAKLLANRIARLLPSLVKPDRVGFVAGRQARDATRRILNLVHSASGDRRPSVLLSLDAEKAFDRIHWGYLLEVLSKFGFTSQFFSAITALYSGPSAHVFTEGLFSSLPSRMGQGRGAKGCVFLICRGTL